jgi:murein DD-endopeptidase MepM/ murein hydrolase activator NlpD
MIITIFDTQSQSLQVLRSLFIFSFLSVFGCFYAQKALDTVDTEYGQMIIYSNKTWAFYNKNVFDGIMNRRIHKIMTEEQVVPFVQKWNNEICFTSRNNDLSKLKDTVWLCVNDDEHSEFKIPVPGIVTSRYGFRSGRNHNGIDLDLDVGDTVCSAWSGKVRYAKYNEGGFGNLVIVRHYNGLETFYAHMSKLLVFPDQEVKAGEPIGLGGNTGHSFGAHLHFEVRFYDSPMNPEEIFNFDKKELKNENLFVHKGLFRPGAKPSDYYEEHPQDSQTQTVQQPVVVRTPQVKYYRVKSGDTLTEIADRNNITVSKLCQLNGIKPTSVLQVGRSLRIK